jgi:predicted phage terminase large subunit-like protein
MKNRTHRIIKAPEPAVINRVLEHACREDFASFVRKCFDYLHSGRQISWAPYLDAMTFRLEQVRVGKIMRLIINLLPRSLKSFVTTVALPAFMLGHDPTKRIIVICYSSELAVKFANDFRAIVNAPWYRDLFPGTRISRSKNTEAEVVTTRGGFRLATSIDGALIGRGGDVIIIDDCLKPMDALSASKREYVNDWFINTVLTRLDDSQNGAIVIAMQRLHVDDLCGRLMRASDDWTVLKLAAIAEEDEQIQIGEDRYWRRRAGELLDPQRWPMQKLDQRRSEMGSYDFSAQYQQRPRPLEGAMINPTWVKRFEQPPARTASSRIIQSWDTGGDNHWSVCVTLLLQDNKFYVLHVLRDRMGYLALVTRAISHAQSFKATRILVEDTLIGPALVAELQKAGLPAIAIKPEGDKRTRMLIQSAKFESGQAFCPYQAPWLGEFENEVFAFPGGRFNDQVDALSQALAHATPGYELSDASNEGFRKLINDVWWHNQFMARIRGY